jgi:hypothetical protein
MPGPYNWKRPYICKTASHFYALASRLLIPAGGEKPAPAGLAQGAVEAAQAGQLETVPGGPLASLQD